MNYTECFNRSRVDGLQRICSPFFVVLVPPCWHGWSITPVCHFRPSGASMLARMEYYARVPFPPVLVPPCWHGWSITPVCHFRPSGASMLARMEYYARVPHLRPFWCPTPSCYTRYSKLQILEFLQRCPLLTARYRSYRASRILGICKQMKNNVYVLFWYVKK